MVAVLRGSSAEFFIFTLSSAVGPGQADRTDDVEFVRLGFIKVAESLRRRGSAGDMKYGAFLAAVSACGANGPFDTKVDSVIRAWQSRNPGTESVDGKVSVMSGGQSSYGSGNVFIAAGLQTEMRNCHRDICPRIDRIPGCGSNLSTRVRSPFGVDVGS